MNILMIVMIIKTRIILLFTCKQRREDNSKLINEQMDVKLIVKKHALIYCIQIGYNSPSNKNVFRKS